MSKTKKENPWHQGKLSDGKEYLNSLKMAHVLRDRKTVIKDWEFDYEPMAGAWFWHNDAYPSAFIIATLFWEQEPAIFFDVLSEDGSDLLLSKRIAFNPSDDFDYDLKKYATIFAHCLEQPETKKCLTAHLRSQPGGVETEQDIGFSGPPCEMCGGDKWEPCPTGGYWCEHCN